MTDVTAAEAQVLADRELMERLAYQQEHPQTAHPVKPRRPRAERAR